MIAGLLGDLICEKDPGEFGPLELLGDALVADNLVDIEEIVKNLKKKSGFLEITR